MRIRHALAAAAPRSAVTALGAVLTLLTTLLFTSGTASAVTWEEDWAVPYDRDNPGCDNVAVGPNAMVHACFVKYGDVLGVTSDGWGEGARTSIQWSNRLKNRSGSWVLYRQGECFNDNGDLWDWSVCNKNFYESSSLNDLDGRGSQLSFKACREGRCGNPTGWVNNDG